MAITFICYPKCSTCKKAQQFLDEHHMTYSYRHIVEDNPSEAEILSYMENYHGDPKKFFNTSGLIYRNENLKERVPGISKEEMAKLLATNGMLVKRPLLLLEDEVLIGFKEEIWKERLNI